MKIGQAWKFPVKSCRVYDADTLMDLVVDLGFGLTITITGRLYGINAPELRGPERPDGIKSRDWIQEQIIDAEQVFIETRPSHEKATGKYGRWLITVWADGCNLNDRLVQLGLAKRATY
jgi:micrococcal nuclease|tara:strand:- start:36967 stop:37323 length:357 start_codon:yes stop_codon:yes gene_type:complete